MSNFRKVLENEIAEAAQAIDEATIRHNTLVELLDKYKQSGNDGKPGETAKPSANISADSNETNKTESVVAVIMKHQAQGLKPGGIIAALKDEGISIGRNYVYSVLNRLQKRGRIQNKRGKYYPTLGALVATPEKPNSSAV